MILCVGTPGSGKSLLLRCLVANMDKDSVNRTTGTIPTTGTDIVTVVRHNDKRPDCPDVVMVREVGGAMAPIWHSYIESGKTQVGM